MKKDVEKAAYELGQQDLAFRLSAIYEITATPEERDRLENALKVAVRK